MVRKDIREKATIVLTYFPLNLSRYLWFRLFLTSNSPHLNAQKVVFGYILPFVVREAPVICA